MCDDRDNIEPVFFEKRLTAVETKLSYLENFVESLQAVVTDHNAQLDLLRNENIRLYNKIIELEESEGDSILDKRPPHY